MKKRKFIAAVVLMASLIGLTTSCLKDGLNDFEALRHPVYLEGHFNPELGIPVGHAEFTVRQMLNYFASDNAYIYVTDDSVVGLRIDTLMPLTLNYSDMNVAKQARRNAKEGEDDSINTAVNYINGEISLASLQEYYDQADFDLQLKNIFTSLGARLGTNCTQHTRDMVDQVGLDAYIDQITIVAEGNNGTYTLPFQMANIHVQNFLNEDTVSLLSREDISQVIDVRPTMLRYSFRLTTVIENMNFYTIEELYDYVTDSLELLELNFNTRFNVDFPLSLSLTNLAIDTSMPMSPVPLEYDIQMGNIRVDSSALIMEFHNSLPMALALGAQLADSVTGEHVDIFDGGRVQIEGGSLAYNSNLGTYVVNSPNHSTIRVTLDQRKLDALTHCNALLFQVGLSSASHEGQNPIVSVQTTDALGLNVYIQARADLNIHMPILDQPLLSK